MNTWDDIRKGLILYTMEEQDSPYYINDKTYIQALKLANAMEHFEFPVPRMFSHGGDCVVFIWGELGQSGSKPLQVFANIVEDSRTTLSIRNDGAWR